MFSREDSVVVLVDLQERLLTGRIEGAAAVAEQCAFLLAVARNLGVPVLVTEQNPARLGPTAPGVLAGETPIPKMAFSAAREPAFLAALAATGRRRVVLCGVEAHLCVRLTAEDLAAAGYAVVVAEDAVGAPSPAHHASGLRGSATAHTETIAYAWVERAGTDEFRALLARMR